MAENLISGQIVARLEYIWAPKIFIVGFTSTRWYILPQTIIVFDFKKQLWFKLNKMAKNIILGLTWVFWAQTLANNFFLENLALPVTRYHGQLLSCTISEKTNLILRKLSDGWADRQAKVIR